MFCFKCGKSIDADSVFCRHCGVKVPSNPDPKPPTITNNPVPGIIKAKAEPGKGIAHFCLDGVWEASTRTSEGKLTLHFTVSEHEPFTGWCELKGRFGKVVRRDEIIGNCHLVMDGDLLLGLQLEGLRNSEEKFGMRIPIHTRSGSMLVGTDDKGEVWISHNIQPEE